MRVLIVDTYYGAFLRSHYEANPRLARQSWSEQRASLLGSCFGTSDFYSSNLRTLGHDAQETIPNCAPLQLAWLKENGRPRSPLASVPGRIGEAALRRLLVRQVERLRPDVVYVQDAEWLGAPAAKELAARSRLLVAQHAATVSRPEAFAPYDLVISSLPNLVDQFRSGGLEAEYLPLAFEPSVLDRLETREAHSIVHVGGYGPIHAERNALLEEVARRVPVDFYGYALDGIPETSPIRLRYRGEAWGLDMYAIRAASRVTLTKHIDAVAGPFANNATLFEATGVGTCLLVDERANLGDLFVPGREVATYADVDTCVSKIEDLFENEAERSAIAAAGQRRTLRDHTWRTRMEELASLLESRLGTS
jgi:spore maturation protein CgeB